MTIEIQFDGGCSPNPGEKYGSYEVRVDGIIVAKALRMTFGHGTNNEAEFESLIAALKAAQTHWLTIGCPRCHVKIATDSTIVENRVGLKTRRAKKALVRIHRANERQKQGALFTATAPQDRRPGSRMTSLMAECLQIVNKFTSYEINYIPRKCNVLKFGH